ncbi:unnamed protein product [Cylindrotheca closterium]|uniref:Uncharacterized protein n=1 Tax=Cylindrotheca closterium TaxID=2856 RepID=A0AAD2JGF4_9STRA|nr:unnamed protein product [Cylindrotheca closterium]
MAEVATSTVLLANNDDTPFISMRQTNNAHRSSQSRYEEEWKTAASSTKLNAVSGRRQELENRTVAGGAAKNSSDLMEEKEGRQQIQEGIEGQDDAESRTNQASDGSLGTNKESAELNGTEAAPFSVRESESGMNLKQQAGTGDETCETITVSPNLLNLSASDHSVRCHTIKKPNRWRSLDMNAVQQQKPRRASLDPAESPMFGRPRQWQKDLSLSTESNGHRIVRDRIQIHELEKKVSSLLHELHESIERETDLEEKNLSLTNENDLLKEQIAKLQQQVNVTKSSMSSAKSSNEATVASSTSAESSSQDPLFHDSDSSKKDKEATSKTQDHAQLLEKTAKNQKQESSKEVLGMEGMPQETEATLSNHEEHAPVKKSLESMAAVLEEPVTPQHGTKNADEQKKEEKHQVHEKQVDWTPPAPFPAARATAPPVPHSPAPRPKGFYIDTCDNSTLSYSLYKGMAEIYDGTVDTGMKGEDQEVPRTAQQNGTTEEDDDEENWEFLTERLSL